MSEAAVEKAAAARRIQSVLRNATAPAPKRRAPRKAPTGKPMKRRSKKRDGMMKKLRSLKSARVKRPVEKERRKRQSASAPRPPGASAGGSGEGEAALRSRRRPALG